MLALIVVLLYVVVLLAVGAVKARRVGDSTGFLLAGRSLGPVVLVGTLLATWTGTGSIFGNAEEAYKIGLPALVLPLSSVVGILALIVMVPLVRKQGRFTLQDLLEERFGPWARVLGTLTLVIAYLIIVSYQLRAAAAVLDDVLGSAGLGASMGELGAAVDSALRAVGLPVEHGGNTLALAAVALLIGIYTALAGLLSVAVTDTFNGVLMLLGVAVALPLVWIAAATVGAEGVLGVDGALGAGVSGLAAEGQGVVGKVLGALPEPARHVGGHFSALGFLSILLPSFLLILGDANLHQRFLSARSAVSARRAAAVLIPCVLLVDGVILLTATAGRVLLPEIENPGHVILELALHPSILPPLLGALLVASILAIIVSTADSFLLSCSASFVNDVYHRFIRPDASEKMLLTTARRSVLMLTVLAFVLALQSAAFFDISLFAYTIYGVGITPVLLAALFWKRATPAAAVASMVVGPAVAMVWKLFDGKAASQGWIGEEVGAVVPAILAAGLVLVVVTLATSRRERLA